MSRDRKAYQKAYYEKNKDKIKLQQNCEHGRQRVRCKDCSVSQICIHGKRKEYCKDCDGSQICIHGKRKDICKICIGSQICIHGKEKNRCKDCDLPKYLINLQRKNLNRVLKSTNIDKTKPSIEYLNCSAEYFQNFIQSKMTEGMTWDNIHLDHIKPVSVFNLENHDEFLDCCHYSNFQPLFAKDNMEKSSKWNEDAEAFWLENIKGKEYLQLFIPA